jgi:hypothetical protein
VSWLRVLPQLGVTPRSSVLPAVTDCPLCGGRLHIYQDTLFGGEWHHCHSCEAVGDMISLAAAYWKLDLVQAGLRIIESDDPRDAETHASYVSLRDHLHQAVAASQTVDRLRLSSVLRRLNITQCDRTRWAERLGRFVGIMSKSELNKALWSTQKRPGDGCDRFLRGRGREWGDMLVVPFYDVPGRVQGLWMIGRDFSDKDVVFTKVSTCDHRIPETGLGLLSAVSETPDPEFGQTVFVVNDTLVAIRIQDKNFRQSNRPLPLISCHPQGRMSARLDNGVLAGKKLVFWGMRLTLDLVRQARAGNGRVATVDDVNESPARYLARFSPKVWLHFVDDTAQSWPLALERLIRAATDPEVENIILGMGMTTDEHNRFLSECSQDTRDRLNQLYGHHMNRRVQIESGTVVETNEHWYTVIGEKRVLLTDAPFRIERIIRAADRNEVYYKVKVTFRGHQLSFTARAQDFEFSPFLYVRKQVRDAGLGVTSYRHKWAVDAMTIAVQFWPPEVTAGAASCGWSEARGAWVFENFEINSKGQLLAGALIPTAGLTRPTQAIQPPADLHPDGIALLSREDTPTRIVWATVASVLSNLIAPVANRLTSGIAVVGHGTFTLAGGVARQLGCDEFLPFLEGRSMTQGASHVTDRENDSGWPVVLRTARGSRGFVQAAWLSRQEPHNSLIELEASLAMTLSIMGGWHVIESTHQCVSAAEYHGVVPLIAPAVLRWFGERGLALPSNDTFGESVLDALSDWFCEIGGNVLAVNSAREVIRFDHGGRASLIEDRFIDTLCRLEASGVFCIGEPERDATPCPHYTEENNLFIPKITLNKALAAKGGIPLEPHIVSRALSESDVLVCEPERGNPPQPGWEVKRTWWETKSKSWRWHNSRKDPN